MYSFIHSKYDMENVSCHSLMTSMTRSKDVYSSVNDTYLKQVSHILSGERQKTEMIRPAVLDYKSDSRCIYS